MAAEVLTRARLFHLFDRMDEKLEGIAADLARRRLRGHVYRTEEGTAVFASTAPDDGRTPPENRGPEPVLEAIRKHVGDEPDPWEWIAGLWRPDPIANGVPHPTVYDGPNLLVTGTSAKIAAEATAAAADRRKTIARTPGRRRRRSSAAEAERYVALFRAAVEEAAGRLERRDEALRAGDVNLAACVTNACVLDVTRLTDHHGGSMSAANLVKHCEALAAREGGGGTTAVEELANRLMRETISIRWLRDNLLAHLNADAWEQLQAEKRPLREVETGLRNVRLGSGHVDDELRSSVKTLKKLVREAERLSGSG